MHLRKIADTAVSAVGLGGMPLSIAGRPDEADAIKVIHAAIDAGMTWIDTADVYCLDNKDIGHNERLIAKALKDRPGVRVATKGGLERPGGAWTSNAKPAHLRLACDASLKALGLEQLWIYQLHAPDRTVAYEDSIGALAELQKSGKIAHVALSNVGVGEIERARKIVPIVSVQNRCSVFEQQSFANGVVEYCTDNAIAFLPHSPVGGHGGHVRTPDDKDLSAVGARHGISNYEVCLAWLLAMSPVMLPIPGASRVASAQSSAKAGDVKLTAEDLAALAKAFPT